MKQSEADSRRSDTRPLNEHKDFDECDSVKAAELLLCHSRLFPLFLVERMRGKQHCFITLDTFESSVIMPLYAVVTCLIKLIKYESVFVSMFSTKQVCMTSLAGDARTPWTRSVSKINFIINYNKTINYFF